MNEYDFVVIGGGSAGYAGARTAAGLGMHTAVIEGGSEIGGLCILRGCMPSKTLLESASRFRAVQHAGEFGIVSGGTARADIAAVIARKRRLVEEFASYRRGQLASGAFDFVRGRAVFLDPHTVQLAAPEGGTRTLRAKSFLVAAGSEVAIPAVPGLAESACLTSDDILVAEELPESLVVLGGGPVALEMASYAAAFGVRVELIQRSPQLLSGSDPDAAAALAAAMEEEGITVHTGTALQRVSRNADGTVSVTFTKDGTVFTATAADCLNAMGRKPSLAWRGDVPFALKPSGRLEVSATQQTSCDHIFAAGDVCGPFEVVHIAIQQGEIAARNAARLLGRLEGPLEATDYRLKVFACFSIPQFACAGATEAELRAAGRSFRTASYPFSDHGKSLVMGETAGFVKLIADASTGELLGAAVVGPEASELIHEVVVAMRFRATAREFASIPHYHPTLSEIWTYPAEELADAQD